MSGRKILRLFASRKANLDERIKRDYIRNGVAVIPCRITEYSDVISKYSVKGCETLNPEFVDYIREVADFTPDKYPLVLNIVGDCLTQEEKETVERVILDDFAYDLGIVEKKEKRHARVFIFMFIGLLVSWIILWLSRILMDEVREVIFILFWFMGDTLCDYIFLTGYDIRRDRRKAGRLASIKVVFSDEYDEDDYTERDAEDLYSEIEKDVKETMSERRTK